MSLNQNTQIDIIEGIFKKIMKRKERLETNEINQLKDQLNSTNSFIRKKTCTLSLFLLLIGYKSFKDIFMYLKEKKESNGVEAKNKPRIEIRENLNNFEIFIFSGEGMEQLTKKKLAFSFKKSQHLIDLDNSDFFFTKTDKIVNKIRNKNIPKVKEHEPKLKAINDDNDDSSSCSMEEGDIRDKNEKDGYKVENIIQEDNDEDDDSSSCSMEEDDLKEEARSESGKITFVKGEDDEDSSSSCSMEEFDTREKIVEKPVEEDQDHTEDDESSSCSMEEGDVAQKITLDSSKKKRVKIPIKIESIQKEKKSSKNSEKIALSSKNSKEKNINNIPILKLQLQLEQSEKSGSSKDKSSEMSTPMSRHLPKKLSRFAKYKTRKSESREIQTYSHVRNIKTLNESNLLTPHDKAKSQRHSSSDVEDNYPKQNRSLMEKRLGKIVKTRKKMRNIQLQRKIGGFTEFIINSPSLNPVKRPMFKRGKSLSRAKGDFSSKELFKVKKKRSSFFSHFPAKKTMKFRIKTEAHSNNEHILTPKSMPKKTGLNNPYLNFMRQDLERQSPVLGGMSPFLGERSPYASKFAKKRIKFRNRSKLGIDVRNMRNMTSKSVGIVKFKKKRKSSTNTLGFLKPIKGEIKKKRIVLGSRQNSGRMKFSDFLERGTFGSGSGSKNSESKSPRHRVKKSFFVKVKSKKA